MHNHVQPELSYPILIQPVKVGIQSGFNYPPKYIRDVPFTTEPIWKAIRVLDGLRETVNQVALIVS